jgi:hypothetical protein
VRNWKICFGRIDEGFPMRADARHGSPVTWPARVGKPLVEEAAGGLIAPYGESGTVSFVASSDGEVAR